MAESKKTEAAVKPVATIKTPAAAETKAAEVKVEEKVAPVKKAAVKKAAAKKETVKKEAAVKKAATVKKAVKAEEKKTVAKKAEAAKTEVKKPAAKKATAAKAETETVKANIVLQYSDKNVTYDTIIENSKNNYQFEMGGNVDEIKKLSVYVKPEENAAYYVVNDKVQGRIGL